MPTPSSVFTELSATTFRNFKKEIKDNVSTRNALYKYIYEKGNYETEDGGHQIARPIDFAENNTYQRYSDWDVLNIQPSEVISSVAYDWKQIAINVTSSGRELRINSGSNRIVSLAKAKIKNAMRTFANNFSEDLYSAGTSSNQIGGLQAIVNDTVNTGTIGGISAVTYNWWSNQVFDCSANSVTAGATTVENSMMLPLWLDLDRGPADCPDLIVMDNTYYQYFEASQTSLKRYMDSGKASAGMLALKYKNADVLFDGNSGIPSEHAYMLNTQYLKLVVHKDADLEVMEDRVPVNQDGVVVPVLWMGNLVCTNRNQQGVIHA